MHEHCKDLPATLANIYPSPRADVRPSAAGARKRIALTFDDGPSKSDPSNTHQLIELLASFGRNFDTLVRATFFFQGVNIDPNIYHDNPVIRAHREGHLVANHSTSHPEFSKLSREQMRSEIQRTNDLIKQLGVPTPGFFRAPYGDLDGSDLREVLAELGVTHVGWHVDSVDWSADSFHRIVKRVVEGVMNSSRSDVVVLFHDGPENRAKTVQCIDALVPAFLGLGCEFLRVDQIYLD